WIALSADRIFLAPGAQFGGGPPDPLRDAAEQNDAQMAAMVSANARYAGEVASSKGYNRDIARAMVDGSVTLVRAAIDGRPYVLTEETLAAVRKARPGAAVETGPRYKKSGDRLCLTPMEALRPEIHMAQATTASRAELFEHLGLQQAHAIELSFTGPPPATIANGLQAGLFLLVLFLALLLIIGELIMETRGYAFVAAGGTILAYLSWSARTAPLGQWALGLFLAAVALFILELLRPTRDGRLGVFCFAVIGHCLALSLIQDAPYLSPDWAARHLDAERRPALQNVALVLAGGTLAGAAVGLMTIARLRRLPRYRRRWRKRFTHWDEGAYLELQRQRGKFGVSLTPITSLAAQPRAGGGFGFSEGGGGILPNAIGASTGRVSLDGQQYEATCVGAIAAGCEIEVMDCTEDRLVVRLRPNTQHAVPPFELPSKYEAMDAQTKYAGDAGNDVLKYPPTEGAEDTPKYPPEADAPKYTDVRDRSKYTPPGGSVTPPKTNDQR
ncbi:MAG TPA: hypothetical protein VL860_03935, partial [Planctomycetota bacterium]|nr:hypothetical protein [Planctomycetota bacterium]